MRNVKRFSLPLLVFSLCCSALPALAGPVTGADPPPAFVDVNRFSLEVIASMLLLVAVLAVLGTLASSRRELQRSRLKFASIFRASPDVIAMTDRATGRFLEINDAFARIMGYEPHEVLGRNSVELGTWGSPDARRQMLEALGGGGRLENHETLFRRKNGQVFPVLISLEALTIDSREVLLLTARDITERKRAEQSLEEKEALLREAQEVAQLGNWSLDIPNDKSTWSEEMYRLLGYEPYAVEASAENFMRAVHPADRQMLRALIRNAIETPGGGDYLVEHRVVAAGAERIVEQRGRVARDAEGRPVRMYGTTTDVTERKRTEEQLRIAAAAFESQEGMVVTDARGIVLRVNRAFTLTTGYAPEDIVGRTPGILQSGYHDAEFFRAMWEKITLTGSWQGEIWDRRKNGEIYPKWLTISAVKDAQGLVTHYIGTHFDITERKKAEERINALAYFDQLTKLPNRMLLMDRLDRAMASGARSGSYGALLFLDLDNFKTLNDTQGHEMGDQLLKQVAARLGKCIREEDTAARQGGDEFVVLLSGLGAAEQDAALAAETIADKLLAELGRSYQIGGITHHSSASIGVTLFKGHSASVDTLMKQADLAMYRAKASGRNAVRFFDPAMEATVKVRADLEEDLRSAVDRRQFILHYQSQVVGDGRITGAEVLVRWLHPQRGLVSPADFVPLAEETDLILPLGHWVLETACGKLAEWSARPELEGLTLAVNVSPKQFRQAGFVDQVLATVKRTGANPHRLKLELTESLLVHDVEEIIEKMHILKARGIGFSLDDFGTGYSSLSYLKRLPLDQLKIDQSFVRDVLSDPNDAAIARTIVALGQSLGLAVIAEGVETRVQRDFLASAGCHAYQGYFFGKPLPGDEFEHLLRRA